MALSKNKFLSETSIVSGLLILNEKVVSKNSVAFGGNAELLNIQEEK
jgi:hypothetical protein